MPEAKGRAIHLDLDGAWGGEVLGIPVHDLRAWGPRLRYLARRADIEAFNREVAVDLPPFVLYGSGDFHHLAGVFLRRVQVPVTVISFDNHPDWDIRPPRWSCGAWVGRALELPRVQRVSVWGCGNFELAFPSRLFANRKALKAGRLEVHPWAERHGPAALRRFPGMTSGDWREQFGRFVETVAGQNIYVTIDMDCLRAEEAVTNWENGLFTAADIAWAARQLRGRASLVGGDLCGSFSDPQYSRWFQRLAGRWDHPKISPSSPAEARRINILALATIWPALVGNDA